MLIIDGTYLIYKSYYRTKKIEVKHGVNNISHFKKIARNTFLKLVADIKNKYKPTSMYIVFDCEGQNFRHDLLPSYKSNRKEKPEELRDIKLEVYSFLEAHNFAFQVADNVEGDDLIASVIAQHPEHNYLIFTGDADMGALVDQNVTLLLEKGKKQETPTSKGKKATVNEITEKNFHFYFPVPPSKIPDFKALQGDKSDFIKGVDGLFRSEVLHLLSEFASIEEFLEKGANHYLYSKIHKEKDKILVNKSVASMKKDCKLDFDKEKININHIYMPEKIAGKIGWI